MLSTNGLRDETAESANSSSAREILSEHDSIAQETTSCPSSPRVGSVLQSLATRFSAQSIQWEKASDRLWCLMCTTHLIETTTAPLPSCLVEVGGSDAAVRRHCATRTHLLRFEARHNTEFACPVELHGQRMLLENHCLYPAATFGPGRVLMDTTTVESVLLGQDVCGGVRLRPYHRYAITELLLPFQFATGSQPLWMGKRRQYTTETPNPPQCVELKMFHSRKRQRSTCEMLEDTNKKIKERLAQWNSSELLSKKELPHS